MPQVTGDFLFKYYLTYEETSVFKLLLW